MSCIDDIMYATSSAVFRQRGCEYIYACALLFIGNCLQLTTTCSSQSPSIRHVPRTGQNASSRHWAFNLRRRLSPCTAVSIVDDRSHLQHMQWLQLTCWFGRYLPHDSVYIDFRCPNPRTNISCCGPLRRYLNFASYRLPRRRPS